MTCSHCVDSVKNSLSKITGISNVNVDLASGKVQYSGDANLNDLNIYGDFAFKGKTCPVILDSPLNCKFIISQAFANTIYDKAEKYLI